MEAKFESKSGDLRVLGSGSPEWYVLKDTDDLQHPGSIDLKGEPFAGETGDQATDQARMDAPDWLLYRRAIDYVGSLGHPFLNDVTVHNPASLHHGDASWTDPVLHGIHIAPYGSTNRWTMLHELGHAWAYPRETGEDCLIAGALGPDTTHGARESRSVAFNEGFANFFASKLDREMSDAGIITPSDPSATKPHKRAYLIGKGLLDLDDAEHSDKGFDQAFRILTQDDVTSELFGDGVGDIGYVDDWTASCAGKGVPTGLGDLADALKVIGDADDQFAAGGGGPTIRDLFDRADERLGTFDDWDATFYRQIVDPDSDDEPHEIYGC